MEEQDYLIIKMTETIYVIGPKEVFDAKYEAYKAKGFDNKGGVRFSNDNTKVLVEEVPEMFEQSELNEAEFTGTREECKVYLNERPLEWHKEIEE